MTYLGFHLIFNIPAIILLTWLARKRLNRVHIRWIAAICGIVLLFTFPWDSWAVGRGIWEFREDRVLFRIGNLPVEEILFFLLETIAVGLLTILLLPRPKKEEVG